MSKDTITITKVEYFNLRKTELILNLLERNNIQNWKKYKKALNPKGELFFEQKESLLRRELGMPSGEIPCCENTYTALNGKVYVLKNILPQQRRFLTKIVT